MSDTTTIYLEILNVLFGKDKTEVIEESRLNVVNSPRPGECKYE